MSKKTLRFDVPSSSSSSTPKAPFDAAIRNDVKVFRERHQALWDRCEAPDLVQDLVRLHRFYYEGEPLQTRDGRTLHATGLPKPWTGQSVIACCEACRLGDELRATLADEELYRASDLSRESPIEYLDLEDVEDILRSSAESGDDDDDVRGEAAVFLLAVHYVKCMARTCSRRA